MLGRDEKMQPGFVDFPNFAQWFGFAGREAASEASCRKFSKTHQVGFARAVTQGWYYSGSKTVYRVRTQSFLEAMK